MVIGSLFTFTVLPTTARVAGESSPPVVVAEHDDRGAADLARVVDREQAPGSGRDPEDVEPLTGHELTDDELGPAVDRDLCARG